MTPITLTALHGRRHYLSQEYLLFLKVPFLETAVVYTRWNWDFLQLPTCNLFPDWQHCFPSHKLTKQRWIPWLLWVNLCLLFFYDIDVNSSCSVSINIPCKSAVMVDWSCKLAVWVIILDKWILCKNYSWIPVLPLASSDTVQSTLHRAYHLWNLCLFLWLKYL